MALTLLALTVSFFVALLCYLFVRSELSHDRSVPRAAETFRINITINPPGSEPVAIPSVTASTASAVEALEGVEDVARFSYEDVPVTLDGEISRLPVYVADPNFLSFFGLEMASGDASTALVEPGTAVLSRTHAVNLFGTTDVLGRELEVAGSPIRVTGVFLDPPETLHLGPGVVVSSRTTSTRLWAADRGASQGEFFAHTYIRVTRNADHGSLAERVASIANAAPIMPPPQVAALRPRFWLLPVTDIYLQGLPAGELKPSGAPGLIWPIAAVGLLILGAACLNLAILVGADADGRIREIGVRRAFGASRTQILAGFAARYAALAAVCMSAAVVIASLALPLISDWLGRALVLAMPIDLAVIMAIPELAMITSVAALAVSSSSTVNAPPDSAIRGELAHRGTVWRAVAASAQFALSIVLVSTTIIIGAQVSLAVHESLPIGPDDVLVLDGLEPPFPETAKRTLADLMQSVPGVVATGLSEIVPTDMSTTMVGLMNPAAGQQQPSGYQANPADRGFFDAYGIEPEAGALFRDDGGESELVVSRSAASALGFSPGEAVGQTVSMVSADGLVSFIIIGVVPDVPMKSIEGPGERLIFTNVGERARYLSVRVEPGSEARVTGELRAAWAQFSTVPPRLFSLRDRLESLYRPLSHTFAFFAGLAATALAIAALGISATASFAAERRRKEMGLRRALGASRLKVAGEMLSSIIIPLALACVVAIPVAILTGQSWLAGFAQRVSLTVVPFGIAAAVVATVALVAAGLQVLPLIARPPADALRQEQ